MIEIARLVAAICLGGLIHLPGGAVEVVFQPVAEGLYSHIGDLDGRSYDNEGLNANLGLVVTPAGAVLIDSGPTAQVDAKIEAAAKKVTTQPIRWVINTGGQDHRWLANAYFSARGIESIAHAAGRADMQARMAQHLDGLKVLKERLDGTQPALPTRWIEGNDHRLEFGGVALQLIYRGGGHTPGDMMVWLPEKNVMFSGDLVYVQRTLGLIEVSNIQHWLASFAVLDALQPRIIVPGHGRVTDTPTARAHTRDLLRALRVHMKRAIDDGIDISAAVKSFDTRPFAHLKHAEVWMAQLANRTYLEMERE
jgi:glyoxylase-like metal-dependent hydrolase (beta-lactamase superfamily II)